MKKRILFSLLSVSVILGILTGCGSNHSNASGSGDTAANGDAEVWNIACIQTEDHPETQAIIKMGEVFSELTDGRYRFEVYPNELLGPQRETLEQVQYGIIEMAVVGNPIVSSFSDGFQTFEMPYLFDDEDQMKTFFDTSDVVDELFTDIEQYNFKVASVYTAGTRNMYAAKPIRGLSDLKGMKIRTAESDTYSKMMKCLGGSATPMSMGEVFTALQTGVVDGAENNEASYYNSKHYEVANYYSLTGHLIVPDYLVINTKLYNSLSEEDKAAFDEAARQATEYEYEEWQKYAQTCRDAAVEGGATVVDDVNVEELRDACQPLHEELCENEEIKKVYDAVKSTSDQ